MTAKYEELAPGVVKRTERRVLGLFIDGAGLDRATRRINRKVDMAALVRGVTAGINPTVARYYTLIPYEDDSRQRAFLDAVSRAGLSVIVKRLPPKGITRQVAVDVEMAADMIAFAMGHSTFGELNLFRPEEDIAPARRPHGAMFPAASARKPHGEAAEAQAPETAPALAAASVEPASARPATRIVTVVCPSRDLSYPISLIRELGADTVTADFGRFGDVLKSAAKWIDLSDSETIWRD